MFWMLGGLILSILIICIVGFYRSEIRTIPIDVTPGIKVYNMTEIIDRIHDLENKVYCMNFLDLCKQIEEERCPKKKLQLMQEAEKLQNNRCKNKREIKTLIEGNNVTFTFESYYPDKKITFTIPQEGGKNE